MKILTKVTVTGASDGIQPKQMLDIQRMFPHVEFGILLSKKYSLGNGNGRFPSATWLRELAEFSREHKLNMSGHLCGAWVDDVFQGKWPDLSEISINLDGAFQRFQLNTHGQATPIEFNAFNYVLNDLDNAHQKVIFQLDDRDGTKAAHHYASTATISYRTTIAGLFDLSHGAGVLPEQWPQPIPGLACGYAGGLSPKNLPDQMALIERACGGADTWIDAETHLMSAHGGFGLLRVLDFLKTAKPWVKE